MTYQLFDAEYIKHNNIDTDCQGKVQRGGALNGTQQCRAMFVCDFVVIQSYLAEKLQNADGVNLHLYILKSYA